jgi:hypothetical protein
VKIIHSKASDSPGYTTHHLDGPAGTTYGGIEAKGSPMIKGEGDSEHQYTIVLHGQDRIDVPDEITSLEFSDGTVLKLGGKS